MFIPLTKSAYLVDIESNDLQPVFNLPKPFSEASLQTINAVVLSPELFDSWVDMFAAYPGKRFYLLKPGDYRRWGKLNFRKNSGLPRERRVVMYFDQLESRQHPAERPENVALVGDIEFGPALGEFEEEVSRHWVINGLTMSRGDQNFQPRSLRDAILL